MVRNAYAPIDVVLIPFIPVIVKYDDKGRAGLDETLDFAYNTTTVYIPVLLFSKLSAVIHYRNFHLLKVEDKRT